MNFGVNTRRAAFENYSNASQSISTRTVGTKVGVAELAELGEKDENVKKAMDLYGWHQGHKVFATQDLSGLKLIANAGSLTFSSLEWRTCTVTDSSNTAQVMTTPFPISSDNFEASLHVPDYGAWLYGSLMCPKQYGSNYTLGNKVIKEPPVYKVSQYLTILDNLATEMLITHNPPVEPIAKTYHQVKHSLNNLINSPDYRGYSLPSGQTVDDVAHKLATLLRDRDGDTSAARECVDYVNHLPPEIFFQAMRSIATDQVNLTGKENEALPSSNLFHHSVFFNGDLIFASRLLTAKKDDENFTSFWVKRKLQEVLKKVPTLHLGNITSMEEAIETIHRQAGSQVENKLRHAYFQKLVQDEILSQPQLSQKSVEILLPELLKLARETRGITSLLIAILPEMAKIPDLNQSLAELLLRASQENNKNKLIIPIESLQNPLPPTQLTSLVQSNIDRLNKQQESILSSFLNVSNSEAGHRGSPLDQVIDNFRKSIVSLQQGEAETMETDDAPVGMTEVIDPSAKRSGELELKTLNLQRDSSGNHLLIQQLYNHIAGLTMNGQWEELTSLVKELQERETDNKRRLISSKNACRLIGRLIQHQLARGEIDKKTAQQVFSEFKPMLPTIDAYLSVDTIKRNHVGRGYISQILQALFKIRTAVDSYNTDNQPSEPIDFFTLPDCIARQASRANKLNGIRAIRQYDCSVCLESQVIPKLRNHNTAPSGEPENNGHPSMPICDRCVDRILITDPRCPACRAPTTKKDYVAFKPNNNQ
ncbi:hypothetical protein [Endozoicomonas ascidiicola]|uniref:hypothetical protein n=1 Tax=Endozoicomonas ascidiicola TaxID=1698521 RepID=UPI000830AE80|nr:hypothetical protein [Endozoicomonas ascidiicola]